MSGEPVSDIRWHDSILVLGPSGDLVAASGDGAGIWRRCGTDLRAIVRRARSGTGPVVDTVADGDERWHVCVRLGANPGGEPAVFVELVSSRVSAEWQSLGRMDSERYQALCRLVSGVVHELRNPLASISLAAELSAMREGLTDDQRERLLDIVHHVDRSEEILVNFRRFSGEETQERRLLSLNELVDDALRLERRTFTLGEIELELKLDADLPPVLADASQLRLVVANLLRNAAESIRESGVGGKVRVISGFRHGVVRLWVEDDGPGVPAHLREKVFEPKFTTKKEGTGVGLAMCLSVARAHGGHIWVEKSSLGGARFNLDLPDPAHSTPAFHVTALGIELTQGPSYSALVFDERPDYRERYQRAISAIGWKVHVADGTASALRKLRASDFDVVLAGGGPEGSDAEGGMVDLYARARLLHPELSGHVGALLPQAPSGVKAAQLRLVGARILVEPFADADLQAFARSLVGVRAEATVNG